MKLSVRRNGKDFGLWCNDELIGISKSQSDALYHGYTIQRAAGGESFARVDIEAGLQSPLGDHKTVDTPGDA